MQGRGGGQKRIYNSTVSLTNNNHYYCVITIREQRNVTINCKNYNNY